MLKVLGGKRMYKDEIEILREYIKAKNTDYSYLLSGEWGCGKTYFIENELKKVIRENNLQYVYISLNGLSDIESKRRRMMEQMAIDEKTIRDKINLKETVIIVDDIDRLSNKISLIEIFGITFSELIEENYAKVIFVGNEEVLEKMENGNYNLIKEKIIRKVIKFEPNYNELLESYIKNNFEKDSEYFEFLTKNIEYITNVMTGIAKYRNLRTLGFCLDIFQKVFKLRKNSVVELNLKNILAFIIFISIEYKDGRIASSDLVNYKELDVLDVNAEKARGAQKDKGEREESYSTVFYNKYLRNTNIKFKFLKTIFQTIITGYFKEAEFLEELTNIFQGEKAENICMKKLAEYSILEEEEIEKAILDTVTFLKEAKYNIEECLNAYIKLAEIEKENYSDNVPNDLKVIIKESIKNYTLKNSKEYDTRYFAGANKEKLDRDSILKELLTFIEENNKVISVNNEQIRVKEILGELDSEDFDYNDVKARVNKHLFLKIVSQKDVFDEKVIPMTNRGLNNLKLVIADISKFMKDNLSAISRDAANIRGYLKNYIDSQKGMGKIKKINIEKLDEILAGIK